MINQMNPEEVCDCVHENIIKSSKEKLLPEELVYEVADFFKVFGDSTRIKILYALLDTELCVGDLTNILHMTQSAISHQLRVLRQNNLVKYRKEGKSVIYSLDDEHVSVMLKQGLNHICHKNKYTIPGR